MQSSELNIEQESFPRTEGFLERVNWLDKLPMALVFGCLLGLCTPGFNLWWMAWVGLVPLLVLIRSCRTKMEAALVGLVFGLGYEAVSLDWLLGLYPLRWMGMEDWLGFQAAIWLWVLESAHRALLFMGFSFLVYVIPMRSGFLPFFRRPYFPYLLSVPLLWVFFHWIVGTSQLFLGVPVNQLAYSQCQQLPLIQIAKWGGCQLLEGIILLCNAMLATLIIEKSGWVVSLFDRADALSQRAGTIFDLSLVAVAIAACAGWGYSELNNIAESTSIALPGQMAAGPPVTVGVLQGNVGIEEQRLGSLSAAEISQRYTSLGQNLGVILMVLPEGVIDAQQTSRNLLLERLAVMAYRQKKEVLVGTTEDTAQGPANMARLIGPAGLTDNSYIKRRLVPFGEVSLLGPLEFLFPLPIKHLLSANNQSFISASTLQVLDSIWGKIGSSICVEVIYPRLIADEVRHGASLLVNVSNLAWFHNSTLNQQILAAAVMRAVENGRYVVLSTNTGISAVIDPSGLITSTSLPGKKGVLVDTVQFLYRKTPFTKMWWL